MLKSLDSVLKQRRAERKKDAERQQRRAKDTEDEQTFHRELREAVDGMRRFEPGAFLAWGRTVKKAGKKGRNLLERCKRAKQSDMLHLAMAGEFLLMGYKREEEKVTARLNQLRHQDGDDDLLSFSIWLPVIIDPMSVPPIWKQRDNLALGDYQKAQAILLNRKADSWYSGGGQEPERAAEETAIEAGDELAPIEAEAEQHSVEPLATRQRRPCYDRDHLWLKLKSDGMGIAAIRDQWNEEHPNDKIGSGASGYQVVKTGLKKAAAEK